MSRLCASPRWRLPLLGLLGLLGVLAPGRTQADEPPAPASAAAPVSMAAPTAIPSQSPAPVPPPSVTAPATAPAATAGVPASPAQLSLKDLTDQGIRQFQGGQFDAAVESFSAAHVLNPNPMFLFNIAQAHRKAGRPREALTHYQLFLRKTPESPLRPETEAYIALVQTQLANQANAATPPATAPAQDLQKTASHGLSDQPLSSRAVPFYKRGWFYGVLFAGAATVGLAVGLPLYFATRPPPTTLGIVDPVF